MTYTRNINILCLLIICIAFISIGCKEVNKNEEVNNSNESIEINDNLETKIINKNYT